MKRRIFMAVSISIACIVVLLIMPVAATTLPVAGFVSNVTSGTTPLNVQFMDVTTNSPTEWIWSFGDGDTSTAQNPTHTYTRAGTYTVTLAATNAGGSNTVTTAEYVTVTRPVIAPVAYFVSNVTSGTEPVAVQFLDTSTNSPTSAVWAFGDGSTAAGPSPSHTYTSAGVYTVTLTVTNAAGSNTVTRTGYITAGAPVTDVPVAWFVSTMNSGTVPQTVQFIDASTNFPYSWVWLFGDGDTSTAQNPLHTYTRIGTYNVTLTATNAWGNHTVTRDNYIIVSSSIPVASFVSAPLSGTAPLAVRFTDTSTNSPTLWDWVFGDGSVSAMQNPSHVYTIPGVYTVSFSAINAAGRGTVIRSDYISVSVLQPPVSSFTSDVRAGIVPLTIQFTDSSTNTPDSWAWSFGDGTVATAKNPSHTYMRTGSYTVILTSANVAGSNTSMMKDYITVSEPPGTAAVTTVRETVLPTSSTTSDAAVMVTAASVTQVPNPILSAIDTLTGIPMLALILALLLITGILIIWWMTRSPKRPRGRSGRDL
ncbi:PKD domain-containing protein [uncultured Methanoregula sp.]|uniref:PKD domain-containing protein n=1 Tax=uncultured Methanoregula sp. TaxID=1005933 RepID=UPI002AAB5AC1|nr:PKD domain-containing protein [uncultured Methanoregula sp.]